MNEIYIDDNECRSTKAAWILAILLAGFIAATIILAIRLIDSRHAYVKKSESCGKALDCMSDNFVIKR